MVTYYQRQRRKFDAHNRLAMRRRADDWLDKAATADQVIGYALIAIIACALVVLVVEAAPRILPAVLALLT
jgi:hypothetical protein